MTIDEMKKILLLILLTAICVAFVSCGKVEGDGLDEFESLLNETSDSSSEQIEDNFAQMVYVVIPQSASSQLSEKSNELAKAITDKTGVAASVKYDNESIVPDGENLEILIGNTSRLRSKEILKSFRLGEYIYCWDRGDIIIGGRDETATLAAIDDFCSAVLHGASSTSLMGEDVRFEKRIEYDIAKITLNGYDLSEFTIAYSEQNKNGEQAFAYVLRDHIVNESGYLLDVIPYSSRNDDTGKLICIGDSLVDDSSKQLYSALLNTVGQDVSVYGNGSYELSAAVVQFADEILSDVSGKMIAAEIAFDVIDNAKATPINICSAFFGGDRVVGRIADVSNKISLGEYDIISFFRMSAKDANDVKEHKSGYEYCEITFENGDVFPILYRANSIKNVLCRAENGSVCIEFKSVVDDILYSLVYSEDVSALVGGDGYRVGVLDTRKDTLLNVVDGLELIGAKAMDTQDYVKSFYIDSLLTFGEDVVCDKTEQSGWSTMFCSVSVRTKCCPAFVKLEKAS